ncbi:unnamed protein product [Schistosoma rodhaini]|uniref:Uncharacterized protein n=1 Tax=Schistosoma rodhaini TaxID=6188 RepID=A0AA85GD80_9TREM|nr:unnamed protein product [Schistosoma rodhaini]CAH8633282.1 unnamed protein product [Schistosoma rodhaini]CAH8633298.1 unnamed protein product [Schistosoma rodhaini]
MMTFAFTDVSKETSQNNSTCISTQLSSPLVLSGLILTLIGAVLGIIIILVRKLHSSSVLNIIFMVITVIILFVGVASLLLPAQWYEIMISEILAGMFYVLAYFLGLNLQLSKLKWKIILFTMYCVFAVAGFILCVLGVTLRMLVLQGLAWICCCCLMFIVSLFTAYYLNELNKQGDCSISYLLFVWIYECIAFVIIIQIVLNSFIDCHSNDSNSNMTMIAQD